LSLGSLLTSPLGWAGIALFVGGVIAGVLYVIRYRKGNLDAVEEKKSSNPSWRKWLQNLPKAKTGRLDKESSTSRFSRKYSVSRIGAVALAMISLIFIALSYSYGNPVFEVNSIIAFVSAIVLMFKDQSQSIQIRVVNRMLSSSERLITELSSSGFGNVDFQYYPEGSNISEVVIVPSIASSLTPTDVRVRPSEAKKEFVDSHHFGSEEPTTGADLGEDADSGFPDGGMTVSSKKSSRSSPGEHRFSAAYVFPARTQITAEKGLQQVPVATKSKLVPPGRALAELIYREFQTEERLTPAQLARSLPNVLTQSFGLAVSASLSGSEGTIEIRLLHPALRNSCGGPTESRTGKGIIGCSVCSCLAVLICYSSYRLITLHGCSYDIDSDTSTLSLVLGPKPQGT
jgi:hypothetical protein